MVIQHLPVLPLFKQKEITSVLLSHLLNDRADGLTKLFAFFRTHVHFNEGKNHSNSLFWKPCHGLSPNEKFVTWVKERNGFYDNQIPRFIPIAKIAPHFLYIIDIIIRIKYDRILESVWHDEIFRGIPSNRGISRN